MDTSGARTRVPPQRNERYPHLGRDHKACPDLPASRPAIGRVDALQAARFGVIATPNRDMRRRRDPSTKTILLAGTCNG